MADSTLASYCEMRRTHRTLDVWTPHPDDRTPAGTDAGKAWTLRRLVEDMADGVSGVHDVSGIGHVVAGAEALR
jgi:hypothetical protein